MLRNNQQALEQLEAELLAVEFQEVSAEESSPTPVRCKIYNTDSTDTDLNAYSEEVCQPKNKKGLTALTVIALCLIAGILGVLAYWLTRYF